MRSPKIKELITKLNKQLAALKPGESLVKEKISSVVYHGADGVSSSMIKDYIDCPALYNAKHVQKTLPREEKKIFDVGSGSHSYLLELEIFSDEFVIQPADILHRRGAHWDKFKATLLPDQTCITQEDYKNIKRMADAVKNHTPARNLLTGGTAETSFFIRDVETNMIIKCRPDYRKPGRCVDYKTCISSKPAKFSRDAKKLGYHISAAMYLDITKDDEFVFIATEKTIPHITTAPFYFDADAMELGRLLYRNALKGIEESIDFNHWPGYTDNAVEIGLASSENDLLNQLTNNEQDLLNDR
jgi:hypothetical protein